MTSAAVYTLCGALWLSLSGACTWNVAANGGSYGGLWVIGLWFMSIGLLPLVVGLQTFRVVISQFLDRFNFDLGAVKRSCVHFVEPPGRIIPFDTFNIFYRPGAAGRDSLERRLNHG